MKYSTPEIEVLSFDTIDVIETSTEEILPVPIKKEDQLDPMSLFN